MNTLMKMSNEIILQSINGIDKEIQKKKDRLNERRAWYLDEFRDKRYTWRGYYLEGYRLLKQMEKLKLIKQDLENHFNKHF